MIQILNRVYQIIGFGRLDPCLHGILEGGVGCGIVHHGAIRLRKEPVIALPVGIQRFLCIGLLDHQIVEPVCKESSSALIVWLVLIS